MDDQPNYPFWFLNAILDARTEADLVAIEQDPNFALALLECPGLADRLAERRQSINTVRSSLYRVKEIAKMCGYMK